MFFGGRRKTDGGRRTASKNANNRKERQMFKMLTEDEFRRRAEGVDRVAVFREFRADRKSVV